MNIRFLDIASLELDDARDFYNLEKEGLGDDFWQEVKHTLNSITVFPEAWHPLSLRTRRCRLRRFPYGVIYQIRKDELLIIAVAHLHRKPDYWKKRVV
jgi:plasmid stabilization system protein ParE